MRIAIHSAEGGVGKTFLACNLALALAERGERVTLLDLNLGKLDITLRLPPDLLEGRLVSLSSVLSGNSPLPQVLPPFSVVADYPRMETFVEIMKSGPSMRALSSLLNGLDELTNHIVIDLETGFSPRTTFVLSSADTVIFLTRGSAVAGVEREALSLLKKPLIVILSNLPVRSTTASEPQIKPLAEMDLYPEVWAERYDGSFLLKYKNHKINYLINKILSRLDEVISLWA